MCSGRIEYIIYFVKTLEDEFWEKVGLMVELMNFRNVSRMIDSSEEGSDSKDCSSDLDPARPLSHSYSLN